MQVGAFSLCPPPASPPHPNHQDATVGTGPPIRSTAHPEVLGVDVQLVAVQLGQLGEGVLDVVQVLDGFPEGGEHFLAMGADHGVANDGGGAGEVPEGSKEPLGPGVDDQHSSPCPHFYTLPRAPPLPCAPLHWLGPRGGPPQPWHPKGGDTASGWGPRARCPNPPPGWAAGLPSPRL
uniref:Uncharacterized protein n=1 Tax=Aquila chrysaetos chrysaetos TaxID=223781 RepID=A0A663ETK4_AQUCH